MVIHNLTLCDITKAFKMSKQFCLPTSSRQASHKDFFSGSPRVGANSRDALGAGNGDLSLDLSAIELVELCGDALGNELIIVGDEAEAARVARETVAHDDAVRHGAVTGEVRAQRGLVRLP